ncbi:hypothetical protein G6F37_007653 [Rhizopus arrhizus]|nr:hypothetical protein G6F38_004387 [Rhizopus arrhizus]KAG1156391.1 hypothetical protein G6F37_007653 [Rhizopus arrhizus]
MEDPLSSLNTASHHFDNGQIKDAYYLFLNTAQNAIQPFFDVKFVHCSIVSKPQKYDTLLCILRTCLDEIEKIVENHSISTNKAPPPLPPKPSTSSKPVLPPKPTRPLPVAPAIKQDFEVALPRVPNGEIDPSHLVPAQTNNNDTLTPSANSKNIPHIPAPPLLTTHRVLQTKLDSLESLLNDYRTQKRLVQQGTDNGQMTESELNDAISRYTPCVAEAKHTLNKIRTVYMTAATIPSILHFQPGIIAYQITRIESAIFSVIPAQALLTHSPKNPHPRIIASTDFFNFITRLIEHSILLPQEASSRAQHIHHWIKIATKCQDLNNYQTLKAIVSALGTPPVQRLKRTWAYIPKKSMVKLESLNELMSESNNYGKYREHMGIASTSVLNGKSVTKIQSDHCKRPTVPFLGTFIHDMTYLLAAVQQQQGTSSDALQKDARVQKLLKTLSLFQSCPPYDKRPNAMYAKVLQKNPIRPAFTQAIHRSKSSFGRLGGAIGFGGNNESEVSLEKFSVGDNDEEDGDNFDVEEQSSLVTQYILMRPWVSQDTVDELSQLREPPVRLRPGAARSNSVGSQYANSLISSSTSSFMRMSASGHSTTTNASLSTLESRPESFDDVARLQGREGLYSSSPLSESRMYKDDHGFNPSPIADRSMRSDKWDNTTLVYSRAPTVPPRPRNENVLSHKVLIETDIPQI